MGFDSDFSDRTPEAQSTEEKTDKLEFINTESPSASEHRVKRVRRQPTQGSSQ